jgi:hypothetical protein
MRVGGNGARRCADKMIARSELATQHIGLITTFANSSTPPFVLTGLDCFARAEMRRPRGAEFKHACMSTMYTFHLTNDVRRSRPSQVQRGSKNHITLQLLRSLLHTVCKVRVT